MMSNSRDHSSDKDAAVIQCPLASVVRDQLAETDTLKEAIAKNCQLMQQAMTSKEQEMLTYQNQVLACHFATKQQYTVRDAIRCFGLAKTAIQVTLSKTVAAINEMISAAETARDLLVEFSRPSSCQELPSKLAKVNQEMAVAIFAARASYLELTQVSIEIDGAVKKGADVLLEACRVAQEVAQEVQLLVATQVAKQAQQLAATWNVQLQSGIPFFARQTVPPTQLGMPFAWQAASALLAQNAQPQPPSIASFLGQQHVPQLQPSAPLVGPLVPPILQNAQPDPSVPLATQAVPVPAPLSVPDAPSAKRSKDMAKGAAKRAAPARAPDASSSAKRSKDMVKGAAKGAAPTRAPDASSSAKQKRRSKKAASSPLRTAENVAPNQATNPASLVGLSIFIPPPASPPSGVTVAPSLPEIVSPRTAAAARFLLTFHNGEH
jgi:hypothetical protein